MKLARRNIVLPFLFFLYLHYTQLYITSQHSQVYWFEFDVVLNSRDIDLYNTLSNNSFNLARWARSYFLYSCAAESKVS